MFRGFDARAAAIAGLVAGLVFMVVEMALVGLMEGSPWGPPRMIAAIVLGREALPPPASFDAGVMMAAMAVHLALSMVLGLVWAALSGRLTGAAALAVGAVFGLAFYGLAFYGMTPVFPWFAMARNWVSVLTHAIFGLTLAFVYLRARRVAVRSEVA